MAKKYVRRKRRRTAFRRRKRSFKRRSTRYDAKVAVKMSSSVNFNSVDTATPQVSDGYFFWGSSVAAASNFMSMNNCPEWDRYSDLYNYFKIAYFKMEFIPEEILAGTTDVAWRYLRVATNIEDGGTMSDAQMERCVDHRLIRAGTKTFTKGVAVVKQRTRNNSSPNPWMKTGDFAGNNYANPVTQVRCQTEGLRNVSIGTMQGTWWVQFKGQKYT